MSCPKNFSNFSDFDLKNNGSGFILLLGVCGKEFLFTEWERVDDQRRMIRFCTSWSTKQEAVDQLCKALLAEYDV